MSTQRAYWLVVLLALFAFGVMPQITAGPNPVERLDEGEFVILDSRLRSAFLQRATGMDRAPAAATAQGRQQDLRRHFAAVIDILNANAVHSLEIALDRLEQSSDQPWSVEERREWRTRLAAERLTNVGRLEQYRDRGRFPINEHSSDRAVPVFVDNYDTACAVGHLMRESGWGQQVASIQTNNNLVYVTDVSDGPVVEWVATSGFTHVEAALIQPAYGLPPTFEFDARVANVADGDSIEQNGLRYSNFAVSYGGEYMSPVRMKLAARQGAAYEADTWSISPKHNDWLLMYYQSLSFEGQTPRWMDLTYSVETTHPSAFIDAASLYANMGTLPNWGAIVSSFVFHADGVTGLHLLGAQNNTSSTLWEPSVKFSPTKKVWIATSVNIDAGSTFNGYVHSFNVVPEPTACTLIAVGSCCGLMMERRKRLHSSTSERNE
jgi:hypothetical protein